MVEGPDFPLILPVKSHRFLCVNLVHFKRSLSFGLFLKDFYFLLEFVINCLQTVQNVVCRMKTKLPVWSQWVNQNKFGALVH